MRKIAVLLALALTAATAFAQSTQSSFNVTATKPAGVVTIAFQNTDGSALVSPTDLGAFTVEETKEIPTVLFADYTNLGDDSDNWSVVFAATAQTGYSYQYRVDANNGGTITPGTPQALSTATVNTVPSGSYGDSSGYVEADTATALGAAAADADQFVFEITAGSTAEANLSTTITATLTYQ